MTVEQKRDSARKLLALKIALALAVVGLLSWIGWSLFESNQRAATSQAQSVAEQAEKKEIAAEAQQALCGTKDNEIYDKAICEKLADAAQEPVTPPAEALGGPSQAELVAAFRAYCAEGNNCKGRDGAAPTADDIAAAFMRFCADGRCTGPAGKDAPPAKDGTDGAKGADGVSLPPPADMVLAAVTQYCTDNDGCRGPVGADGQPGPPPTAEAVLAAVQQVCADDACRGPVGPVGATGDKGEPGTPGRGLDDMQCGDNGRWTAYWSDGTTSDSGACRDAPGVPSGPPIIPPVTIP